LSCRGFSTPRRDAPGQGTHAGPPPTVNRAGPRHSTYAAAARQNGSPKTQGASDSVTTEILLTILLTHLATPGWTGRHRRYKLGRLRWAECSNPVPIVTEQHDHSLFRKQQVDGSNPSVGSTLPSHNKGAPALLGSPSRIQSVRLRCQCACCT
jgi:hypothetical protein